MPGCEHALNTPELNNSRGTNYRGVNEGKLPCPMLGKLMLANEGNVSFLIGFEVVLQKKKSYFADTGICRLYSPLPQKGFLGQIIIMVIPRKTLYG